MDLFQLGPMKYHYKTRLGNWSEEWELEETKKKDYLSRKDKGQLLTSKQVQRQNYSSQKASVTFAEKGTPLQFGMRVMLKNKKTGGVLNCNIDQRVLGQQEGYPCQSEKCCGPQIKSVFVLQKAEKDFFNDNVVHYGQKVRFAVNPRLTSKPLLLHSAAIAPQKCAKLSRKQECSFMLDNTVNTVWEVEHPDQTQRFECKGEPVKHCEQVLLKHSFTGQWLATDSKYALSKSVDEVFVHSYISFYKTQNLISEKMGRNTTDIPLRQQHSNNLWTICTACKKEQDFDESTLDQPKTAQDLLCEIRTCLTTRGAYGLRGLGRIFQAMDQDGSKALEFDDFRWGLRNHGLNFNVQEVQALFKHFDQNNNGSVDFFEFMNTLRGCVSKVKLDSICSAWCKLDAENAGTVCLETLVTAFNAAKHPAVLKGYVTEQEVFNEFVTMWDKDADGMVTKSEFCEYFKDVAAAVDDDCFCLMMKGVWGL